MFNGSGKGGKYSQLNNYISDSDSEDDDFVQDQLRSQKEQLKQQDEGLDLLSQGAERLGKLSLNIHEELSEQNKILDQMEEDLDKATTTLHFVTAKTRELIQKSGGKKNFIIIIGLSLIVVLLILIILYS